MNVQLRTFPLAALAALVVVLLIVAVVPAESAGAGPESAAASAPPDTIRWPSAVGEVVFPHRLHAEDLGAECASCHHGIVAKSLKLPHPDYFDDFWVDCDGCHNDAAAGAQGAAGVPGASLQVCATCHPSRSARPNVEMPTTKVAIHRSCWGCHAVERGAKASAQCSFCHQRPANPEASASAGAPAAAPSPAANSAEARTP